MDDHAASGLSVPSLTVVLGASAEIPSRITARISALFAANDGAGGGASTFRSVFVWPYNNVVALGNLCAHLRQVRAGGYLTKYLVLLDMRFAPPPSEAPDATLKHLLRLVVDAGTAVVLYNVSPGSCAVPVELMDTLKYVVRGDNSVSTDTTPVPVRYPPQPRASGAGSSASGAAPRVNQMAVDLELLGFDPAEMEKKTLTIQRIRKQYRKAALESHPDKNAGAGHDRFHEVHAAFKRVELFFCLPKNGASR